MQNIVRVPKKPKKTSQGGPKHCEGTQKTKKKQFSRPHETQPVTTEEAGFHEAWKIVFFGFFGTLTVFWASLTWFFWFFWYPHSVLHANHQFYLVKPMFLLENH